MTDLQSKDPITVWIAFRSIPDVTELVVLVLMLLKVVANQGGVERVFSDLKVKQTQRRARLGLPKIAKMTKVSHFISKLVHICIKSITSDRC